MFVCELGGMCGAMLMHVQVRKKPSSPICVPQQELRSSGSK